MVRLVCFVVTYCFAHENISDSPPTTNPKPHIPLHSTPTPPHSPTLQQVFFVTSLAPSSHPKCLQPLPIGLTSASYLPPPSTGDLYDIIDAQQPDQRPSWVQGATE